MYDVYDLYDLANVAGWEPCNLHDLGHLSWVGSVLKSSSTTSHKRYEVGLVLHDILL